MCCLNNYLISVHIIVTPEETKVTQSCSANWAISSFSGPLSWLVHAPFCYSAFLFLFVGTLLHNKTDCFWALQRKEVFTLLKAVLLPTPTPPHQHPPRSLCHGHVCVMLSGIYFAMFTFSIDYFNNYSFVLIN